MVRERFAGAFGLLGAGRGRTGSWIRSWKMVSEEAYAHPDGAHQPGGRFSESGHPTASSSRGTDTGEERNRGGDETSARGTGGEVSARSHRLLSVRAAQGTSPETTSRVDCPSWQIMVNEKKSSGYVNLTRQPGRRAEVF